ncbi:hypothetical protein [Sorangium sp. So ce693]
MSLTFVPFGSEALPKLAMNALTLPMLQRVCIADALRPDREAPRGLAW